MRLMIGINPLMKNSLNYRNHWEIIAKILVSGCLKCHDVLFFNKNKDNFMKILFEILIGMVVFCLAATLVNILFGDTFEQAIKSALSSAIIFTLIFQVFLAIKSKQDNSK